MSICDMLKPFYNNYKNSKIIIYFILFVLINLIIVTSYYNNCKPSLDNQFSFLTLKPVFAIEGINNNDNFASTYNATSINEARIDKQLVDVENYKEAIRLANYILPIEKNNTHALNDKGLALYNLGNYTGAIQYYDKDLAINPKDSDAILTKGLALDNLGNHTQAIQYYDKALAINPVDAKSLANKGLALYELGRFNESIAYYDKALALNPNDTETLNNKGNAFAKLGLNEEAIEFYNKALKLIGTNPSIDNYSSHSKDVLPINTNENKDPFIVYAQISDFKNNINPKIKVIKMNLAYQYMKTGEYQLANATYVDILTSNPYDGCALLGKANAIEKLGHHEEAMQDYDTAKKLSPNCDLTNNLTNIVKIKHPDLIEGLTSSFSFILAH